MKKILSVITLILSLSMILSLSTMFVSAAPEGTAINTADEFAAMAADGKYYLNADITIVTTYPTPFTGTFDGNGHKVIVAVPMFAEFNGTVSNLTIEGDISAASNLAPFALFTKGMTAINLTNNTNVTVTDTGLIAGGFVAETSDAADCLVIFRNSVNNGNITINTPEGTLYAGGFIGFAQGVDFAFCENNGLITANISPGGKAAGFVARVIRTKTTAHTCPVSFTDCTNRGTILAGNDAGGLIGYLGISGNDTAIPYVFNYCENFADITGGNRIGGLIGYCYASGVNQYSVIQYCISVGTISVGHMSGNGFAGPLIGYTNSTTTTIENNIAVGELKVLAGAPETNYLVVCGSSSKRLADYFTENNYIYDNGTIVWYSYATADSNVGNRMTIDQGLELGFFIRCTLAEVTSGSLISKIKTADNQDAFEQPAGEEYPAVNKTLRAARLAVDPILNPGAAEETTATPPTEQVTQESTTATEEPTAEATTNGGAVPTEQPTAAVTDPPASSSGCKSTLGAFGILSVLLCAGAAVAMRKKAE